MARYPEIPLGHKLEFAPGADLTADPDTYPWQDHTTALSFARDRAISAKRGGADEQAAGTSEWEAHLKNPTGRYTTDNAESDLWPYFDLNCPVRHSIDAGTGPVQRTVQYLAEAEDEWPSGTPHLCFTRVRADGLFRRIGQGKEAFGGPVARAMLQGNPIAFWALEDPDGSTAALSGLRGGGTTMLPTGSVSFAAASGPLGAAGASLPTFDGGGKLLGEVAGCSTTGWRVEWIAKTNAAEGAFPISWRTTGTATSWRMIPPNTLDPTVYLQARLPDTSLANNCFNGLAVSTYTGDWHHWALVAYQNGSQVTALFYQDGVLIAGSTPATSYTLGAINAITINPMFVSALYPSGVSITGSLAYVAVYNSTAAPTSHLAMGAWVGEEGHDRWARLCGEQSVPYEVTATRSTPMGPQGRGRLLDQLREIEATDMGRADDSQGRAAYRAQSELYNQTTALTLDANRRQLFMPFTPKRDDQKIRNVIVASTPDGANATVVDQGSIDTVGSYDDQITVNVADPISQLADAAGFRVWLGIQPGKRYPSVTINFLAAPGLVDEWLRMRVGDLVVIANPPLQHAKGNVRLLFTGWKEQWVGRRTWRAEANCVPASPWDAALLDDVILGRLGTGGCGLTAELAPDALSFQATNTDGVLWTTDGAMFPHDIILGQLVGDRLVVGEQITLSGVSGASNPQTFTVQARSVNGVRKTHPAGADLQVFRAMVLGR